MAEQEDKVPTDEEFDAEVQSIIDKCSAHLEEQSFGAASTALSVLLGRICADCPAPEEILTDSMRTLIGSFDDFRAEQKPPTEVIPDSAPRSAN